MVYLTRISIVAAFTACSAFTSAGVAQQTISPNQEPRSVPVSGVVHIAGLTEVKPDVKGSLRITSNAVIFSNDAIKATIPRARILNVFVGDQRTEPWGTTGKIARKVIPYGGGAALGAMTNGQVDLLTIESRDDDEGYHGVVFAVPFQKAARLRDELLATLTPPVVHSALPCSEGGSNAGSVLLAPIAVSGTELPDEYRILLYEQLYKQLKLRNQADTFMRTGDLSAGPGCNALTLRVTVEGFRKGNRALRASTGPLGLFLGTTSLSFNINLQDRKEKTIFDAQMRKSNRGDSDSLGIADGIAKSVARRMNKELRKRDQRETSAVS
jgi:hypothetical protein